MSAYTTIKLNRTEALRMYNEKRKCDLTNKELEDALDYLYKDTLNNHLVVDDEEEEDNE